MKGKQIGSGYDMYFRGSLRSQKAAHHKKQHAREHTKRLRDARIFNIPDEQMAEPPVVPKDERKYWH